MSKAKRLIDADRLEKLVENHRATYLFKEDVLAAIAKQPVADAVEVVRCKDCKHWHEETGWCNHHSHFVNTEGEACHPWESPEWKMLHADDFCSYGERRADENET